MRPEDLFTDVRVIPDMTNDEYHAQPWNSLSKTRLWSFRNDPQWYFLRYVSQEIADRDTEAKAFGRLVHSVVLEREGHVDGTNWASDSLAVFRPSGMPNREPDIQHDNERLWVVTMPEPGIIRHSNVWGEVGGGRIWNIVPDRGDEFATGYCAFGDMIRDGVAFRAIPDSALTDEGHKRGKAWTSFKESHEDETLLRYQVPAGSYEGTWYSLLSMRRRLRQHGEANRILYQGGESEVTIEGKCRETGLTVRCRLDRQKLEPAICFVADLKTSLDSSPGTWRYQADRDGLHMQAAIYTGLASQVYDRPVDFRFVTVAKSPPFRPEVYDLEEQFVECGVAEYLKQVRRFQSCIDTGNWEVEGFGECRTLQTPERLQLAFQDYSGEY